MKKIIFLFSLFSLIQCSIKVSDFCNRIKISGKEVECQRNYSSSCSEYLCAKDKYSCQNIKIRKPYYLKDRNLVLRDLSGDEKKKLFNHIDLELFVGLPKNTVKKHIWDSFYDTVFKVKDDKITSEQLKHDTQYWLSKFISIPIKIK